MNANYIIFLGHFDVMPPCQNTQAIYLSVVFCFSDQCDISPPVVGAGGLAEVEESLGEKIFRKVGE